MKHLVLFSSLFFATVLRSQCFQIQSILVDACAGSLEAQNEMVTFQVGSLPLNTANLAVNWPNNSYLGIVQNAGTAADIANVNATILGCGFLKEPIAGLLPANSKVLLVTSTSWSPLAQSFANLTDTLVVIFQAAGNTSGHFANYSSSGGLRTLNLSFSLPLGCTDAVTYDRGLLITQSGSLGAQDGGAVEFTSTGIASYVNHGCQAPFIPLTVDNGPNKTVCPNASQSFTATVSGSYSSVLWTNGLGAGGSFSSTNSITTTYSTGAGDNGTVKLYCTIFKACGTQTTSVKDSVLLTITPLPTLTVSPSVATICSGQSATLNANTNTAVTYTWSTNAHTSSIQVNTVGVYTLQVSNGCGSASQTATVSSGVAVPTLTIVSTNTVLCAGQSATLSINGSTGTYNWNTGATTSSIIVNSAGTYSASVTNACGQANSSLQINSFVTPTVNISSSSTILCSGNPATLTASGNTGNFLWSNGATTPAISVSTAGIYTVGVSNQCGTATASVNVSSVTVNPLILTSTNSTICPNQTATLTVNGGNTFPLLGSATTYSWSNNSNTGTINTTSGGTITVYATNSCGTYSESIIVQVYNIHAGIVANPSSGVKQLSVTFVNTSSGASNYVWNFGNGMTANGYTVSTQTYTAAGDYTATIVASDGVCTDNASVIIHVLNELPELIIPNVFTPNNDLVNDVFKMKGYNITNFKAVIFDRWGLELFSWNDILEGWDGKTQDNTCSDGTYFYILTCKDADNKDIKKQGTVTLLR